MRSSNSAVAWSAAILTSALGAATLFDTWPGINWPIWIAAASLSLILSRLVITGKVERPLVILLAWATLLATGVAITANGFLQMLLVVSDAMLLGLATITLGARDWASLSAKLLVAVPFLAPFRVVSAAAHEVGDAPNSLSSPRSRSIVKGALFSVPLVLVLVALLGTADPVIQWTTERLSGWLPDWTFGPRLIFFVFLLILTLGANSLARRQTAAQLPDYPRIGSAWTLGLTEQRMMLWSAAVVLWVFVLLQVSYFVHPPPAAVGSGITFAEFARRGFGELSLAVTIVGTIIIVLEYARPAGTTEQERTALRRLEFALVIALELILISAFRRVILYEEAYGFTTARLFAQTYMVVMAVALGALALEIAKGAISVAFGRRVAEMGLAAFTIMVFWNHEAWIVGKNIDRARETGKFDAFYSSRLSPDAIPTLVQRRAEIPQPARDTVEMRLACSPLIAERRWFEWNRRESQAKRALEALSSPPCRIKPPMPSVEPEGKSAS